MFTPLPGTGIDPLRIRSALASANLPTLLMVLHQLTGQDRWLHEPYRPDRGRGLDDNDTGGFPEPVQREIREAAAEAILAWDAGRPAAISAPSGERLLRMMAWCMGENSVPDQYEPMMAAEMGFVPRPAPPTLDSSSLADDFKVVVIGAGIGGLLASMRLGAAGIPHVVFERNDDIGGTWLTNDYPGAGVDTPSYLYSYSFFPRQWAHYFPKRDEVMAYLRDFADTYDLLPSIKFQTEVLSADFDEECQRWSVVIRKDGATSAVTANAIISAVGIFSRPLIPEIPGKDEAEIPIFHSAEWPRGLTLTGKRVAIIGSGASAMQIVPASVGEVSSLTIFQRSPMWAAPVGHYFLPVPQEVHWLIEHVPFYHRWYRFRQAWTFNDKAHPSLFKDPSWPHPDRSLNETNDRHRQFYTRHILSELEGREDLHPKAIPTYPPFGKRMLIDNGWFAAIKQPHVELFDEACVQITSHGVRGASGVEREVDVVVLCTGFESQNFLAPMNIHGRGGRSLQEEWGCDNARAYLGLMTPGYPNLFIVYGPNTNGAGGSYLSFAESQIDYIVTLVRLLASGEAGAIEPRAEVFEDYNRRVDNEHARMVWTHPGMSTYYRNSGGRVVVNRPWSVVDYWHMTAAPDLDEYVLEPVRGATGVALA